MTEPRYGPHDNPAEGALEAFSDETKSPSPSQLSLVPSSGTTLNPDPAALWGGLST